MMTSPIRVHRKGLVPLHLTNSQAKTLSINKKIRGRTAMDIMTSIPHIINKDPKLLVAVELGCFRLHFTGGNIIE